MFSHAARLDRLRGLLPELGADAILVSQPESRFYLSGYTGHDLPPRDSAGYLLVTRDAAYLLTDPRTSEQAEREAPAFKVEVYFNQVSLPDVVRRLAAGHGLRRIAFEAVHLPWLVWDRLRAALADQAELVPARDAVDRLRVRKDAAELRALQAAVDLLDECFAHVAALLRPGLTERQVAREVERYLRERGSETAFPSIVASGPNASMPHAVPTDRAIGRGEPITIDIGARVDGYCSDLTRTVCLGPAPDRLREVYALVLRAQEEAERRIRPGMTGRAADAIARDLIAAAGYGDAFKHGLGHGIGLEVHEPPWVSVARGDDPLEPGMVFSVEPGIYLPGWGGVRIEDLVLLEADGCRVLSRAAKQLEL